MARLPSASCGQREIWACKALPSTPATTRTPSIASWPIRPWPWPAADLRPISISTPSSPLRGARLATQFTRAMVFSASGPISPRPARKRVSRSLARPSSTWRCSVTRAQRCNLPRNAKSRSCPRRMAAPHSRRSAGSSTTRAAWESSSRRWAAAGAAACASSRPGPRSRSFTPAAVPRRCRPSASMHCMRSDSSTARAISKCRSRETASTSWRSATATARYSAAFRKWSRLRPARCSRRSCARAFSRRPSSWLPG